MREIFKILKLLCKIIIKIFIIYLCTMPILAIMIDVIQKYLLKSLESNTPISWILIPTIMLTTIYTIKTYSNFQIYKLKKELTRENIISNRKNLITDDLYFLAYTTASITIILFEICQHRHMATDNVTISIWSSLISLTIFIASNWIMDSLAAIY